MSDTDDMRAARAMMRTEKMQAQIARVVATAPPLTEDQRNRLALLMRPIDDELRSKAKAAPLPALREVLDGRD